MGRWLETKEFDGMRLNVGIDIIRVNFSGKSYDLIKNKDSIVALNEANVSFFKNKIEEINMQRPNRKTTRQQMKQWKKMIRGRKKTKNINGDIPVIETKMINDPNSTQEDVAKETRENLNKVITEEVK